MKNKRGFVLLIALIFMQVITLLGLYAVQNSLLELKIAKSGWKPMLDLQIAEAILKQIEKNELTNCLYQVCYGDFQHYSYQYQVERLYTGPCGIYDRITLLVTTKMTKIALHSVVGKTALNAPFYCKNNSKFENR